LAEATLRVVHAVEWRHGHAELGEPKSDSSHRPLKLPEFAVKALKEHLKNQRKERRLAGDSWKENGLVFTSTIGTLLDYANVRKEFLKVCELTKVSGLTLHGLRHTCATLLLVQGAHPKLVQATLGHSQISLTMDTYSHVSTTMQAEAASLMDEGMRKRA